MSIGPSSEHPDLQGDPRWPHAAGQPQPDQPPSLWPVEPTTAELSEPPRPGVDPGQDVAPPGVPAQQVWTTQYGTPTSAPPAQGAVPQGPWSAPYGGPTPTPTPAPPVQGAVPQAPWSAQYGTPTSAPPVQGGGSPPPWSAQYGTPTSAPPTSGPPQQQYAAPAPPVPQPGPAPQQAWSPQYGPPTSGPPQQQYGPPTSGPPQQYGPPISGPPQQQYAAPTAPMPQPGPAPQQAWSPSPAPQYASAAPAPPQQRPVPDQQSWPVQYDSPTSPPPWSASTAPGLGNQGPQSAPPAPAKRGRTALYVAIGLLVGILLAGPAGYFVKTSTTSAQPKASTSATPGSGASLSAYESVRRDLNKQKFSGDLAAIAEPWLPYLGGCLTNTDPNGPTLNQGEKVHVACLYGGISTHFALYTTAAARDDARTYHVGLNTDAANLAPGLVAPAKKIGAKTKAPGQYIEYAYRLSTGITICGLWWDRDADSSALMLEAVCDQELGGKWEPLRELWQSYS